MQPKNRCGAEVARGIHNSEVVCSNHTDGIFHTKNIIISKKYIIMLPFLFKTGGYLAYYMIYYASTCVYRMLTADPSMLALAIVFMQ